MTSNYVSKMSNYIRYPLFGLDMSPHVAFHEPGKCYIYDLYAVVNHYGTMNGGHYTATVKAQE